MLLGLDYDSTYTVDREFWRQFIGLAHEHGHTVIVATNRCGPDDVAHWVPGPIPEEMPVPVIYCNGQPKRKVCAALGHHVDVWIDDMPHLVDFGNR